MKDYAVLYSIYNSTVFKIVRITIAIILFFLVIASFSYIYLLLFSSFLIFEVFFRYKISKVSPRVEVSENKEEDIYSSFALEALSFLTFSSNTKDIISNILKTKSAKFILQKSDILKDSEIKLINIPIEEVLKNAFEIVKILKGKFVTHADILVSYLLLSEKDTKILFSKDLKKEDILQILLWSRTKFPEEEVGKKNRVEFWGEGIGESWITGWTIETQKYMIDMTSEVLSSRPVIIGRQNEYIQLMEGMYKGKSALLVGETGSGRKEIAKFLAYESFMGNMKGNLYHQRFYLLYIDALLAGTKSQGDLEQRLDNLIAELAHAGNLIIFIPSFENILGASSFQIDLSGVLVQYMERGTIRIIGTITPGAYKKFVEKKKSFVDNLEVIEVEEPDEKKALAMLFNKSQYIESFRTAISYKALIASLKYSNKYFPDRVLPGSAIALLKDSHEAASIFGKAILEEEDVLAKIEEKTKIAVGKPKESEKKLLLSLENVLHKRIIGQNEAVNEISESLRRLRAGLSEGNKPTSFLFLGPTGVGKTETAKTLSRIYFGGEEKIIRIDMSEFSGEDSLERFLDAENPSGLTSKMYDNPFSLVLLDEFEKADPRILNLFLQVLDDGRLTDNKGKTVSFTDANIIATSNAGSEFIREEVGKGAVVDKKFQKNLLELLQKQGIFKPELLNRFEGIIVFKPLSENEIKDIIQILLSDFGKRMQEQEVNLVFDDKVIDKILKEGFDREFGARPILRYIQDNIEDMIAQKILKDEIKRGDKISISTDGNQILISKT